MILALFLTSFEYELVDASGYVKRPLNLFFFCMLNIGLCCAVLRSIDRWGNRVSFSIGRSRDGEMGVWGFV
jgi:hypothetical protein